MAEGQSENKNDDKVDFTQLTEVLKGLPEGVQDAVKTAIREASGEQRAAVAAAQAAQGEDGDEEPEEVNLEGLSRDQLVKHIDKSFTKAIAQALKPIQERLENTSTDAEVDRVKREFAKAKDDFPDFMDWKDEMRDIISAHPDLSAESIYLLARAKNPDKAKEIDEKLQEGKSGDKEKELSERKRAFGGLTPTSGTSEQKDGKKQPKDAAQAAWNEVFAGIPDDVLGEAMEG